MKANIKRALINAAKSLNESESQLMSYTRGISEAGYRTREEQDTVREIQNEKQAAWRQWDALVQAAIDAGARSSTIRDIAEQYIPELPGMKNRY